MSTAAATAALLLLMNVGASRGARFAYLLSRNGAGLHSIRVRERFGYVRFALSYEALKRPAIFTGVCQLIASAILRACASLFDHTPVGNQKQRFCIRHERAELKNMDSSRHIYKLVFISVYRLPPLRTAEQNRFLSDSALFGHVPFSYYPSQTQLNSDAAQRLDLTVDGTCTQKVGRWGTRRSSAYVPSSVGGSGDLYPPPVEQELVFRV